MKKFLMLIEDQKGATAIEYALIAAFISIVAVSAMTRIGTAVTNSFNNVANGFNR